MKLRIYSISLLLSFLVVLCHGMIPHHHHDNQICVVNEHCEDHSKSNNHDGETQNHQHGTQNNPNKCCLIEYVPNSLNNINFHNLGKKNFAGFFCDLYYESSQSLLSLTKSTLFEPDPKKLHSLIIHSSIGLRAPPVV